MTAWEDYLSRAMPEIAESAPVARDLAARATSRAQRERSRRHVTMAVATVVMVAGGGPLAAGLWPAGGSDPVIPSAPTTVATSAAAPSVAVSTPAVPIVRQGAVWLILLANGTTDQRSELGSELVSRSDSLGAHPGLAQPGVWSVHECFPDLEVDPSTTYVLAAIADDEARALEYVRKVAPSGVPRHVTMDCPRD